MAVPSSQIVMLGEQQVGRLLLAREGTSEFRLLESYKKSYPRMVLGQAFLDDLNKVHRSRVRLPPWFSNLLPEGALKELLARQVGSTTTHEYALLHRLRDDLPGNVRLMDEDGADLVRFDDPSTAPVGTACADWKFSLAGVQLKFSALREGRGLTVPASGAGGDWIVKLPDMRFAGVPANEQATMQWARASGVDVPESLLVNVGDIAGLQSVAADLREPLAYAVRRFDRPMPGTRVHIEDFAQIFGHYPERKYKGLNYESIARLILAVTGDVGLRECLRRMVFMIASGNGDAHAKNWSLVYADGVRAALSPAYDLVSTIQYMADDGLALNLANSKRWADVTMASFRRLAGKVGSNEALVVETVNAAVNDIRDAWRSGAHHFGYSAVQLGHLVRHMKSVPLLN